MDAKSKTQPPVLDVARFEELTLGDAELQLRLLKAFVRQSPKIRQELEDSVDAGGPPVRSVLHKLRGSCHFIAADRLLAAAQEAEPAEVAGARPTMDPQHMQRILREMSLLDACIAALIERLATGNLGVQP